MKTMTIGQLAKTSHVKVETVRYYERRGLMPPPPRRASGYRQYALKDVQRIRFIKHAQSIGFTLNEIAEMLALRVESAATCGDVTKRIDAKLADVEEKIKTLRRMKKTLVKLKEACREPGAPSSECPILETPDAEDKEADDKPASE
ncbi:MAG: heavy metal-responsive transcriptional regulator [Nitrospiria bacterium]